MTHTSNSNTRINSGTQACAACKYQRRKCAPDCTLAPYFPHDRQRQFLNAHKLFGVSNITKIIRNLSPRDKDTAMRTIIYQSDMRANDPVGGCYRIMRDLQHQIEYCKAELDLVLQQLAFCKAQALKHSQLVQMTAGNNNNNNNQGNEDLLVTMSSCNSNDNNDNAQIVVDESNYQEFQALMRCYEDDNQGNNVQNCVPIHQLQGHQQDDEPLDHVYTWTMHDQELILASSNSGDDNHGECYMVRRGIGDDGLGLCGAFEVKPQIQTTDVSGVDPYDDDRYYATKSEDAQVDVSYDLHNEGLKFNPQQTTDLISEVMFKNEKDVSDDQEDESFPHHHGLCEHDLRSAATLFTLTN